MGLLLVFSLVALLIFVRRSHDLPALVIALVLLTFPVVDNVTFPAFQFAPPLPWPALLIEVMLMGALVPALYMFPDGRFVPRWTRPLALV